MDVKEYMNLPYNYVIKPISDESGTYFYGTILELDGCQSTGETIEEVYNDLREAMEGYIETKLSNGYAVPKHPRSNTHYPQYA